VRTGTGWLAAMLVMSATFAQIPGSSGEPIRVTGTLTRRGPDLSSFWVVTDANGKPWQLSRVTAEQQALLLKLQSTEVVVVGRTDGHLFLDQVHALKIQGKR
jgi:hypothetical protein